MQVQECQGFEELMPATARLINMRDEKAVLDHSLQIVRGLGFDRVRIYLLSEDKEYLVCKAQSDALDAGIKKGVIRACNTEWKNSGNVSYGAERVWEGVDEAGEGCRYIPLLLQEEMIGQLAVDNEASGRPILEKSLGQVVVFAPYVAVGIDNARRFTNIKKRADGLEAVLKTLSLINSSLKLEDALQIACQAAVELLEVDHSGLVLFMSNQGKGSVSAEYPESINALEMEIPVHGIPCEERLIRDKEPINIYDVANESSLGSVRELLIGLNIHSILLVPIQIKDVVVGSFSLDAIGQKRLFTREEIELCKVFALQLAVAIDNAKLVEKVNERNMRLELLLKVSNALSEAKTLQEGLQSLAQILGSSLSYSFCQVLLLEEDVSYMKLLAAYYNVQQCGEMNPALNEGRITRLVEWPGLPKLLEQGEPKVLHSGEPEVEESLRQFSEKLGLEKPVQLLLIVPLKIESRVVGILNLGDVREVDQPPMAEEMEWIEAVALQASGLIDRMHQQMARENLHNAVQQMSHHISLDDVLQDIMVSMREVLGADCVAIRLYDAFLGRFIPDALVAVNIAEEQLRQFQEEAPEPGRTAHKVMEEEWIGVHDIHAAEFDYIGNSTRETLNQCGIKSFQAILLKTGSEMMGVLYVNYKYSRKFEERDRRYLDNLAKFAALSLQKAKLLDQLQKTQRAAEIVSGLMTLGDLGITLSSVATETRKVIGCDAVVLYPFDPDTNIITPPVTDGVIYPERVSGYKSTPNSLVHKMLQKDNPYTAEKVNSDPLFQDHRFVKDEEIESCLAIPLKVKDREGKYKKVGVMFVNYRTPHHFTRDELKSIELFANQAAVAIRNAHLFQDKKKKLEEQQKLGELSKEFLDVQQIDEVLDRIFPMILSLIKPDGCAAVLLEKRHQLCVARIMAGEAAHQVEMRQSEMTGQNDFDLALSEATSWQGMDFGFCVPMRRDEELIGVISLYTREFHTFTNADVTLLSIIADQAAIAIKMAGQYDAIKRKSAYLDALHEAAKAITKSVSTGSKGILNRIIKAAVRCLREGKGAEISFGTIQLYDEKTDQLNFESVYTEEDYRLDGWIGETRSVKSIQDSARIGITGRTILMGEPQIVSDVSKDPDYIEFDSRIKSALTVPLLDGERVLGVLGMESDQQDVFDEDDEVTLEALAELAVSAIRNALQYDDLKSTRTLADARTALAWMGMTSSSWRHMVHGYAITIADMVDLAVSDLEDGLATEVKNRLGDIYDMAQLIQKYPITAPLSIEEGLRSILVNTLLHERMKQLLESKRYISVNLRFNFMLPSAATVRANPDWLIRALEVLVGNAIDAMSFSSEKVLTVSSRVVREMVQIEITDTGKGIPPDIFEKILEEPINQPQETKKLGVGLLMARLIAQVYHGDIRCERTDATGTTMVLSLPLER